MYHVQKGKRAPRPANRFATAHLPREKCRCQAPKRSDRHHGEPLASAGRCACQLLLGWEPQKSRNFDGANLDQVPKEPSWCLILSSGSECFAHGLSWMMAGLLVTFRYAQGSLNKWARSNWAMYGHCSLSSTNPVVKADSIPKAGAIMRNRSTLVGQHCESVHVSAERHMPFN